MNYRILLSLVCTIFSFSSLQAQCLTVTAVTVKSITPAGPLCLYTLDITTDASSGTSQSVKIFLKGTNVDESFCVGGFSATSKIRTISPIPLSCSVDFGSLEISYNGYQNGNGCNSGNGDPCSSGIVLNPLPAELTAFRANPERFQQVQLEWVTASEDNNAIFSVEHSTDGRNFKEIAEIEGQGTTNVEHYYTYMHKFPESGINYYRLKQIDFDGTTGYSEVISIEIEKNTAKPFVIANSLAKNEITLMFNDSPKENARVEVFNANGVLFYQNQIDSNTAYHSIYVNDYEPGIYFVRVPIGKEYRIERFVKVGE